MRDYRAASLPQSQAPRWRQLVGLGLVLILIGIGLTAAGTAALGIALIIIGAVLAFGSRPAS